jgi:hypothetical protein
MRFAGAVSGHAGTAAAGPFGATTGLMLTATGAFFNRLGLQAHGLASFGFQFLCQMITYFRLGGGQ